MAGAPVACSAEEEEGEEGVKASGRFAVTPAALEDSLAAASVKARLMTRM